MDVVLMACCNRKAEGGSADYKESAVKDFISPGSYNHLMTCRRALATLVNESAGPDLGGDAVYPLSFLPAIERYTGVVYESGCVRELYPSTKDRKILIISALYGMLDAYDPIRQYNHEMKDSIKGAGRLYTWWKTKGLGKLVQGYIFSLKPHCIHVLLPQDYLKALRPWSASDFQRQGIEYITYEHPGLGIGILRKWGEDLAKILQGY